MNARFVRAVATALDGIEGPWTSMPNCFAKGLLVGCIAEGLWNVPEFGSVPPESTARDAWIRAQLMDPAAAELWILQAISMRTDVLVHSAGRAAAVVTLGTNDGHGSNGSGSGSVAGGSAPELSAEPPAVGAAPPPGEPWRSAEAHAAAMPAAVDPFADVVEPDGEGLS